MIVAKEILSDDGSIFIRIDYHFGHYIKCTCDEIFGKENFQNEIVINRVKRSLRDLTRFNVSTESLYFYSKSNHFYFNNPDSPRRCSFCGREKDPIWDDLTSPGLRKPPERIIFGKSYLPRRGRHFSYKQEKIDAFEKEGRLRLNKEIPYYDLNGDKIEARPEYLQTESTPVDTNWTDIKGYAFANDYPTENSEELLNRIIESCTQENELVLDFFGGSGTTSAVAEKLGRRWITCDIGKFSFYTIQKRILQIIDSKSLDSPKKKYGKSAHSFIRLGSNTPPLGAVKNITKMI